MDLKPCRHNFVMIRGNRCMECREIELVQAIGKIRLSLFIYDTDSIQEVMDRYPELYEAIMQACKLLSVD